MTITTPTSSIATNFSQTLSLFPKISITTKKVCQIALVTLAAYGIENLPVTSAGIWSGIGTAVVCIGGGLLFPASAFWGAAPCYEATLWATANPLIP